MAQLVELVRNAMIAAMQRSYVLQQELAGSWVYAPAPAAPEALGVLNDTARVAAHQMRQAEQAGKRKTRRGRARSIAADVPQDTGGRSMISSGSPPISAAV
jgi:hypothetical protein